MKIPDLPELKDLPEHTQKEVFQNAYGNILEKQAEQIIKVSQVNLDSRR